MLDEQEVIAMFGVLRDLMETPATDSTRRDSRDEKIAADFVFHRDLLHHEIVMPGVCARWDVTESVMKKAVSRCREQAYAHLQSRQESWEYFSEPGIARSRAERGVPIDGDFHSMLARELRQDAEEYRAASKAGALPRKRRNRGD